MHGQAVDIASNIALVLHRKRELNYLGKYIEKRRKAGLQSWQYSEWLLTTNGILQTILISFILFGSIHYWQSGQMTIGGVDDYPTFNRIIGDLLFIGMSMNRFMENYGRMKEGLDEISPAYDVQDIPNAKPIKVPSGEINFQNVDFQYKERKSIIKKLSLHIPAGQKVGIIGESGAGKSTLSKLILRLYDVQEIRHRQTKYR